MNNLYLLSENYELLKYISLLCNVISKTVNLLQNFPNTLPLSKSGDFDVSQRRSRVVF